METTSPSRFWRISINLLKVVTVFIVLALVLIPGLTHILVNAHFMKELSSYADESELHLADIKKDLETLQKNPIFKKLDPTADAGFVLNAHVPVLGGDQTSSAQKNYEPIKNYLEKYKSWAKDKEVLITSTQDIALRSLNTDWMLPLKEKTSWSLTQHPDVSTALERIPQLNSIERIAEFAQMPIPRYEALRDWAAIYMMKMAYEGSPRLGLEMYRKVAELIQSHGTLTGHMVAADMLKKEPYLAATFAVEDWTAHNLEAIEAFERISWGWVGLVRNSWLKPLPAELTASLTPQNGICAAAFENVGGLSSMYDFLGPKAIFEPDFSQEIEASSSLEQQLLSECRMEAFHVFSLPTEKASNPFWVKAETVYTLPEMEGWSYNKSRIPYLRRLIGLQLMTIAQPNFFVKYKQKSS